MPIVGESTSRGKYVLDRSTFERRATCDVEEPVPIFEAAFAIALGDVQRNRLGGTKPLISGVAADAVERLGVAEGRGDVVDGEPVNVEAIVVKDGFSHGSVVSSRSTSTGLRPEYEYDSLPERFRSTGGDGWFSISRRSGFAARLHRLVLTIRHGDRLGLRAPITAPPQCSDPRSTRQNHRVGRPRIDRRLGTRCQRGNRHPGRPRRDRRLGKRRPRSPHARNRAAIVLDSHVDASSLPRRAQRLHRSAGASDRRLIRGQNVGHHRSPSG